MTSSHEQDPEILPDAEEESPNLLDDSPVILEQDPIDQTLPIFNDAAFKISAMWRR
ncbi:unnamed protein product [Eruca vesicaria subsp. sativa]|uniref:Uncharacterized protein n=1 Tax=Eruca vesicaria subsp. sativa TaxID=29727 RepID=A0ABC8J2U2_ERUVS|nr:unnamed protein product [Eruca vesicaria subsp. sativa]